MNKPAPVSASRKLYDSIAQEVVSDDAGVVQARMMGMSCLKVRNKMFAGYWQEAMVFKLTGEHHKKALALKGAHLFDPSMMNRPMKEWDVVPYAHKAKWRGLTQSALEYTASQT